ncbi:hypothetical protein FNV43_RR16643 [Rhamnella rubrinervis]|uniref:Peptidase A1 domain-containing protein n=1 Tax=Rhamnella rubrinervis TaxID=2594499 RepID=A0A8K0GZ56_9ROSA|nr:hypothetical protein FNV43_RR16643 [Rhamnella rubrinervis]
MWVRFRTRKVPEFLVGCSLATAHQPAKAGIAGFNRGRESLPSQLGIYIGSKRVHVPYEFLLPKPDGNGGVIVDSGTYYRFMEKPVFEAVVEELDKHMGYYPRVRDFEAGSGLRPCYNYTPKQLKFVPKLTFQFKLWAMMELPFWNYFMGLRNTGVMCMAIVSYDVLEQAYTGPAIILGNYVQQNFYVEYDLVKDRLGIKKQNCDVRQY